jgi:hypothetical protein
MGKEMLGEELHSNDVENIHAFVARDGSPKKKKKNQKKGTKAKRKNFSPQEREDSPT